MFTGDLADRGEPKAYQQLREMVEPLAERFGAQVVWCMGNHDDREAYARGLYDAEAPPRRARPGVRRRRAAHRVARHERGRLPPRRDQRRAVRLARLGAGRAGAARHLPGDAPPADPGPDAAGRRDHRARRPAAAGRSPGWHRRADDPGRPLPLLVVQHLRGHPGLGRVGHLLPQRHRAAATASSPRSTPTSRSTWCTCTPTRSSPRSCRPTTPRDQRLRPPTSLRSSRR